MTEFEFAATESKLWSNATPSRVPRNDAFGEAFFPSADAQSVLQGLAFEKSAPLNVMAVELFPQDIEPQDPLGADLGSQRILRTSPLAPVPVIC